MHLKTINESGIITLENYSEKKYRDILIERNRYVLRKIHSYGEDYGGSHCTDESDVTYEEIIPERILVKNGHFCGVCIYTDYDYINGGYKNYTEGQFCLSMGPERSAPVPELIFPMMITAAGIMWIIL